MLYALASPCSLCDHHDGAPVVVPAQQHQLQTWCMRTKPVESLCMLRGLAAGHLPGVCDIILGSCCGACVDAKGVVSVSPL